MTQSSPCGPGFDERLASQAEVMEVYGTTMLDCGDECAFVLRDEAGTIIGETRVSGY